MNGRKEKSKYQGEFCHFGRFSVGWPYLCSSPETQHLSPPLIMVTLFTEESDMSKGKEKPS